MVKSLSGSAASKIERCVASAQSHDSRHLRSLIRLLFRLKDSLSLEHLHCAIVLMPPNCRRTVAMDGSPLSPSQTSFRFVAFSSDHNQGIHLNVSGVCTQRGWSKSPNRARNYAPSGREKCSESWRSCTTARARHLSQVNKNTNPLRQFGNDRGESASRSKRTCDAVRRKGNFVAGLQIFDLPLEGLAALGTIIGLLASTGVG